MGARPTALAPTASTPNAESACTAGRLAMRLAGTFCAFDGDAIRSSSVVRYPRVELLPSARRHGIDDRDVDHAVRHAMVVEDVGEDPGRYLVVGPDRSGQLLELVVLDRPQGPAVIHAMAMRAKYRRLLPPGS